MDYVNLRNFSSLSPDTITCDLESIFDRLPYNRASLAVGRWVHAVGGKATLECRQMQARAYLERRSDKPKH